LHVVVGSAEIRVRTLDGTVLIVDTIVAIDPNHDLALLAVHSAGPLPSLTLGDSDVVAAGDPVLAIGNPLGVLDYTVSDGLISSVREISPDVKLLQISAPISQGSSGGPLFNSYGEVIGVSTAIFTEGQNLNFGVPSNYVHALNTARKPMTVVAFAELTRQKQPDLIVDGVRIVRAVPVHPLAIFDGCKPDAIQAAVEAIDGAIQRGAPLYNQGDHAGCFQIYEETSNQFEHDSGCTGVREAFGAGLLRASTLATPAEKAWALRDTFDGLIDVALRFAAATRP
jgi:serine protease Do